MYGCDDLKMEDNFEDSPCHCPMVTKVNSEAIDSPAIRAWLRMVTKVESTDPGANQRMIYRGKAFPPRAEDEDLSSESDVDDAHVKGCMLSEEELLALGPGVYKVCGVPFMDTLPVSHTPDCDCASQLSGQVKKGTLITVQEVVRNNPAACPHLSDSARQERAELSGWFYGRIDEPVPGWVALASGTGDIYSKWEAQVVLTIHLVGETFDGLLTVECSNMGGDVLANLDVDPDELLINFKKRVRKELRCRCAVITPDGRQLGSEHDQMVMKLFLDDSDVAPAPASPWL